MTDRPIFEADTPERVYWRAAAYDTYTGQGWLNTDAENVAIERNQPLGEPQFTADAGDYHDHPAIGERPGQSSLARRLPCG